MTEWAPSTHTCDMVPTRKIGVTPLRATWVHPLQHETPSAAISVWRTGSPSKSTLRLVKSRRNVRCQAKSEICGGRLKNKAKLWAVWVKGGLGKEMRDDIE